MTRPIFLAAAAGSRAAIGYIDKIYHDLHIATDGAVTASMIWNAHVELGDPGVETKPEEHFARTLTALNEARVVVAVVDGPQVDEEVAFLIGYAFAAGKPVVAFRTDGRAKSVLVEGAIVESPTDLRALARAVRRHL